MDLGKIIGTVVSTRKLEAFDGFKLLVVEPLDNTLQSRGEPIVAVDIVQAGEGDVVYYELSEEAGAAIGDGVPCDATVIGIVDQVNGGGYDPC